MRKHLRGKLQRGFTLIEIVAALAIIGLGLVGILSLFPVGIDASKRAGDLTHATELARGVLNEIRAGVKNGDLTLSEAKGLFASPAPQDFRKDLSNNIIPVVDDRVSGYYKLFQYQVRFDDPHKTQKLDDLNRVGLQKVAVTVSWPSDERNVKLRNRIRLVTFIRFSQ